MESGFIQRNTKKTLTSGKVNNLATDCEELTIRGAVAVHQEGDLKTISTHGHSSFHSRVKANILRNTGVCTIKDFGEMAELSNARQLKIRHGNIKQINSSGKLIVEQTLQAKQFNGIGVVKAKEIQLEQFNLKLSGNLLERIMIDYITK